MAIANDIIRKQGDTYPIEVSILKENGAPLDLTGASDFLLGVAETQTVIQPDEPLLLVSGGMSSGLGGKVDFNLSTVQANGLAPGEYFAEIQFQQAGYVITTETFRYRVKGQIVG